jgi:hypothetical protein
MNYHVFVIASTVIFYIFIKYFVTSKQSKNSHKKLLFYTLLVPVILYTYHFTIDTEPTTQIHSKIRSVSTDMMSDTYPLTSSSL